MPSEKAIQLAASCWCDERTSATEMDTNLATVFAELIDEYREALQWCGGASDFHSGGKAFIGYRKLADKLL